MRHLKIELSSLGISRCLAAAAFVLLITQAVPSAFAGGFGGLGCAEDKSGQIELCFQKWTVIGGDWEIGTVQLSQPVTAPNGTKISTYVTLNGQSTKDLSISPLIPASLTVPQGSTGVSFQAITSPVSTATAVVVTACISGASVVNPCAGSVLVKALLTLEPNGVSSVSFLPATVSPGGSATGTVKLQNPAPQDVLHYQKVQDTATTSHYEKATR